MTPGMKIEARQGKTGSGDEYRIHRAKNVQQRNGDDRSDASANEIAHVQDAAGSESQREKRGERQANKCIGKDEQDKEQDLQIERSAGHDKQPQRQGAD